MSGYLNESHFELDGEKYLIVDYDEDHVLLCMRQDTIKPTQRCVLKYKDAYVCTKLTMGETPESSLKKLIDKGAKIFGKVVVKIRIEDMNNMTFEEASQKYKCDFS